MSRPRPHLTVRNTRPADFGQIIALTREVYPSSPSWSERQLESHLVVFPEGQFVAEEAATGRVVGMSASLVVLWDDYDMSTSWRDFTDQGMFTNHDPVAGRTLYGAEVMVRPSLQRRGVGRALYRARRDLAVRLGLLRIRAGSRLRGYHRCADELTPQEYVRKVVRGELRDPTLSFQLRQGFRVLAVVADYLRHDPESLGYAAVIEWLNPDRTGADGVSTHGALLPGDDEERSEAPGRRGTPPDRRRRRGSR
jgi:ribosomal protein S18 acetylase RimI-like enzyme